MARRTGIPTMLWVAIKLCVLLAKFTPIITSMYPTNTALLAALAAASVACGELSSQLELVRDYGD